MRTLILFALVLGPLSAAAAPVTGMLETAPGVSIYYEKHGDGPNAIVIPGRLFLARDFASLARRDRTLVFYDMRNRGASSHVADGTQLNIAEDVRDLEAVRRHFELKKFDLVGYSYLGLMTALYTAEHPGHVRRLAQLAPVPRQFPGSYPASEKADDRKPAGEADVAKAALEEARASGNTSQRDLCELNNRYSSYFLVVNPTNAGRVEGNCQYENEWPDNFQRHLGYHFADIQKRAFPAAQFERVDLPVLVIHGRLDTNAPYGAGREWARTFPNARLITVDRGAHNVWLDDAGVVKDIGNFFDGDWPSRAQSIR